MLIVAANMPVKTEQLDSAIEAATTMAQASRQEPGCIAYAFHQDIEDACRIHIFEKWESLAALRAHFATPHMAAFSAQIPRFVAGPIEARRYEIASEGPVLPD